MTTQLSLSIINQIKDYLINDKEFVKELVLTNKDLIISILNDNKNISQGQTNQQQNQQKTLIAIEKSDKSFIIDKYVTPKISNNVSTKELGQGYIILGKRILESESETYFIERTSATNPEDRLKEWSDRKSYYTKQTKAVIKSESQLHIILDKYRISRKSNFTNKNEIEWFDLTSIKLHDKYTNLNILILLVDNVCTHYDQLSLTITNQSKININTASGTELQKLPRIGPILSERIIAYRENKKFTSIEGIMEINRIGPRTYKLIKDLICIGQES